MKAGSRGDAIARERWETFLTTGQSRWSEWVEVDGRPLTLEIPARPRWRWIVTTRKSNVQRLREILGEDVAVLVIPGPLRFGQWRLVADNLGAPDVVFLGDADPYDFAILASLLDVAGAASDSPKVRLAGVDGALLDALEAIDLEAQRLHRISSRLKPGERDLRRMLLDLPGLSVLVRRAVVGVGRRLGDRKIELEALLGANAGPQADGVVRSAVEKAFRRRAPRGPCA